MYDPFVRGRFPVGVQTIQALDTARDRLFPCEIWYPAAARHGGQDAAAHPGTYPLIIYSHPSGAHRRAATFLCTHLSSHGYVVAALDHSEVVAVDLARGEGETAEQKNARVAAVIANRVPDVRFLLDRLLDSPTWESEARPDPTQVGIVGHSFGGWTALASPDVESRIRAVVALAPGGASQRKPGILPTTLNFTWGRDVPTLYLVAEDDTYLPLAGMYELYERTPATRRMVILRRADHYHFMDDAEKLHEAARATPLTGELEWISKEMRPFAELCSGEQAGVFVRGLTLCHMDAILRRQEETQRFWSGDLEAALAGRSIDAIAHKP
jgi:predicted dienelactone hydrolase